MGGDGGGGRFQDCQKSARLAITKPITSHHLLTSSKIAIFRFQARQMGWFLAILKPITSSITSPTHWRNGPYISENRVQLNMSVTRFFRGRIISGPVNQVHWLTSSGIVALAIPYMLIPFFWENSIKCPHTARKIISVHLCQNLKFLNKSVTIFLVRLWPQFPELEPQPASSRVYYFHIATIYLFSPKKGRPLCSLAACPLFSHVPSQFCT